MVFKFLKTPIPPVLLNTLDLYLLTTSIKLGYCFFFFFFKHKHTENPVLQMIISCTFAELAFLAGAVIQSAEGLNGKNTQIGVSKTLAGMTDSCVWNWF